MRWVGESSSGRLAHEPTPVPPGHVAVPDPHAVKGGGSGRTQEVPDPYGGSEASADGMELPFLRGTWRLRNHPQAENRSGAIGLVRKEPGPWAWLLRPLRVVTDNYAGPALLQ